MVRDSYSSNEKSGLQIFKRISLFFVGIQGDKLFFYFEKSVLLRYQRILVLFLFYFLLVAPALYAADIPGGFEDQKEASEKEMTEASYVVNMHYEYDDADINNLLLLRAQEAGLDLAEVVILPPLDNMGDQIVEQLREERFRYGERVLLREIDPVARTILVPVNLNNIHWAGLVIRLDEHNQVLRIQYIDPLGESTLEDSIPEEIRRALRIVYGRRIYVDNLMLLRQTDRTSCGALTVENLIRVAQDNLETEVASEELTRLIRNHHISLLEQFMPDLQFNARQENSISRRSTQKEVEVSFQSIFNDMLFYKFLQGRLIFLYGTSTAGKTSIANYIKNKSQLKNVNLVFTGTDAVTDLHILDAHFRYSPDIINLLRCYFTIKEILRGIDSATMSSELIKKTIITERKARFIQTVFDELRANQKDIMQRFCSYSERPHFCTQSFLPALISGKTVIVDTVCPKEFFQEIATRMILCRIDVVMVYCPPRQLIDRLYYRNAEPLKSGSTNNCRPGAFPLAQYARTYEPTVFSNQSIDNIDFSDIQIPIRLPEICRLVCEHDGQLHRYRESQWTDTVDLMQRSFGVNTIEDRVFVKPKHRYHFFVNTGKEETSACVDKLLKSLWGLESCSDMVGTGMLISELVPLAVADLDNSTTSNSHDDTLEAPLEDSPEDSAPTSSSASPDSSETSSPSLSATDVDEDESNETTIAKTHFSIGKIELSIENVTSDDDVLPNIYQSFVEQLMDILHAALFDTDTTDVVKKLKELERQIKESNLSSAQREELTNRISAIKILLSQDVATIVLVLEEQEIDRDAAMGLEQFEKIFGKLVARDPSEVSPRVVEDNYLDIAGATAISDKAKQVSNSATDADRSVGVTNFGTDLSVLSTLSKGTTLNFNLFEQERTGVSFSDQTKLGIGSIFDIASSVGALKADRLVLQ